MKFFRNRTVLGIVCIVMAVIICFGISPMFSSAVNKTDTFVRVVSGITKGSVITENNVELVEIGSYNQPENLLKTADEVVGKYAVSQFFAGDYISGAKISETPVNDDEYLYALDGYRAISLTLQSFACGLSGKLQPGDIVSVIVPNYNDSGNAAVPPELQYVKVLAVTDEEGYDSDEIKLDDEGNEEETELPSTVTVLVMPEQADILAEIEADGAAHIMLVYRGDEEIAETYLDEQKKIIESEGTQIEAESIQETVSR